MKNPLDLLTLLGRVNNLKQVATQDAPKVGAFVTKAEQVLGPVAEIALEALVASGKLQPAQASEVEALIPELQALEKEIFPQITAATK